MCVLSKIPVDYLELHELGSDSFLIELAADNLPYVIMSGILPNDSFEQIDTLRSFITANNPYSKVIMYGDLSDSAKYLSPWQTCVKNSVELSAEADNKGHKQAFCEYAIKSDDNRNKASTSIEYKENEKGEKEIKAKIKYKKEF